MGSFSYTYADYDLNPNKKAGIQEKDIIKVLIPEKFGGGFLKGKYEDCGIFETFEGKKYDLNILFAYFNSNILRKILKENFEINSFEIPDILKEEIRYFGLQMMLYDETCYYFDYGLKIIRENDNRKYEEVNFFSINDPNQGWSGDSFDEIYKDFGNYLNYIEYLKIVPQVDLIFNIQISLNSLINKLKKIKKFSFEYNYSSNFDRKTAINRVKMRIKMIRNKKIALLNLAELKTLNNEYIRAKLLSFKLYFLESECYKKNELKKILDEKIKEIEEIQLEELKLLNEIIR